MFNIFGMIKSEILKYKDKSGKPIAIDMLDGLEKSCLVLDGFLSKLDANDVQEIINLLPARILGKYSSEEKAIVVEAIASIPKELKKIEAGILVAEQELESK